MKITPSSSITFQVFFEKGIDPLHVAAAKGQVDMVRRLIRWVAAGMARNEGSSNENECCMEGSFILFGISQHALIQIVLLLFTKYTVNNTNKYECKKY